MSRSTLVIFAATLLLAACKQDSKNTADRSANPSNPPIDTATGAPKRAENPWQEDACVLLPDADFQHIFGTNPEKDVNKRSIAGSSFCLWVWHKPDWKERGASNDRGETNLNPDNSLSLKLLNYGTEGDAQAQAVGQRPPTAEDVPGLGNTAFWVDASKLLFVQRGPYCLNITLDWADVPHDNLEKAKAVAAAALKKM
ncbi:MAG: hypothetical protein ACK4Q5_00630 [Saprospiraceae bacterium]